MELLVLVALGLCLKAAADYAGNESGTARAAKLKDIKGKHPNIGRTRRSAMLRWHDRGYWAGVLARGFPEARHGFAAGWHAHKTARDEALVMRARAKADHHENRAGVLEQIRVHCKRMRQALEEQLRQEEQAVRDFPGGGAKPPLKPLPGGRPDAPGDARPDPSPGGWNDPPPGEDGWPAGVKHQRNGTKGSAPGSPEPAAPSPASSVNDPSPATTGAPVATAETTYSQDIAEASAIAAEAEQHLADLKSRRWADRMEALAGAGLDSATLSRAADMHDSIEAQIKAAGLTLENATAFRDGLIGTHAAGHEYHASTEGGGAEKSYLVE